MDEKALVAKSIEPNPHRLGLDEARLKNYGVSVWALVGYLDAAGGDVDRVAADYELPRVAVEAALAYYRRHRELIDARLAANVA